jgi:hypothetical protein
MERPHPDLVTHHEPPGFRTRISILSVFRLGEGGEVLDLRSRSFHRRPGPNRQGPSSCVTGGIFLAGLPRGSPLTRPITVRASINSPSLAVCARQHSVSTACWNTIRNSIRGFATRTPTVSQKSLWHSRVTGLRAGAKNQGYQGYQGLDPL